MHSDKNSVVAIFDTHNQAEAAIRELQRNGVDMKELSIVGKDCHTEENVIGYYSTGDRMAYWGKLGGFGGCCTAPRSSGSRVSVKSSWTTRSCSRRAVSRRTCPRSRPNWKNSPRS
jgi:hypothetical protein